MAMTVDARVEGWKQELLELSNRNPLLSMSRSTTRMATLRITAPSSSEIYAHLADGGRPLTLVGTETSLLVDQEASSDGADLKAMPDRGLPTTNLDPASNPKAVPSTASGSPTDRPPAKGTIRVGLSPERADRVGRTLRTKARASEQE